MTSSLHNRRSKRIAGFTLTELMVSVTIATIILAGVLSTFLMVIRSGMRSSNYSTMEAETRRAFEQLGIDSRMANDFYAHFNGSDIDYFTLTIPNADLTAVTKVTYGYDSSNPDNKTIYRVPGDVHTVTTGRVNLINKVEDLKFYRYNSSSALIPSGTTTGVKHIQVSVSVKRTGVGLAATTQIIRSSAFTLRNISL